MKIKRFIIITALYVIISIALDLVIGGLDWPSVIRYIIQGIIFSLVVCTLGSKFLRKFENKLVNSVPTIELSNDEKLLLESPASHMKGREAVGGKLFLTDRRLVFKSHKLNLQNHKQEFPLTEINTVEQGEGKFERVFQLTSRNNKVDKFFVDSPSRWLQTLQHQLT